MTTLAPAHRSTTSTAPWTDQEERAAQAIRDHRWEAAHELLDQGASVVARDPCGQTLLMTLVTLVDNGYRKTFDIEAEACAQRLLTAGADPNALDEQGVSLLYAAMNRNLWSLVKLFAEHGADSNRNMPEDSESVLQRAVQLADANTVRALLDHGADLHHLRDDQSILADLMWAMASWGDGPAAPRLNAVLDLLLERGISVIGAGPDGLPENPLSAPLVRALPPPAMNGLQRLLDLGALRDDPRWDRPAREELLLTAVREGHAGSIAVLLDAGVAQDFDQDSWAEITRSVAQHERFGVGTTHHSPTEQARAQARLDGIRVVIEQAALQHTMRAGPTRTTLPSGARSRL